MHRAAVAEQAQLHEKYVKFLTFVAVATATIVVPVLTRGYAPAYRERRL